MNSLLQQDQSLRPSAPLRALRLNRNQLKRRARGGPQRHCDEVGLRERGRTQENSL